MSTTIDVKTELQQRLDEFSNVYRTGIWEDLIEFYTPDAIMQGRTDITAIKRLITQYMVEYDDIRFTITDTGTIGKDGLVYSTIAFNLHKRGEKVAEPGKEICIWKKNGDKFCFHRAVWNADEAIETYTKHI
ncbi:uncharacterized protein LOC102806755 [Saccoglossus kowalevskii]|uniref:Uncharacterized protein LOC102806755 n=1 Tax=Saccoglossus kowalevskii TaxID=10224 RepID=A0ABM0MLW8_SACKO|nr:PREDICTED: uncharacterized protein LOC102806755 [Saccoglossus kowalevskii]